MTEATINQDTSNFLSINRERIQIALGENKYKDADFDNISGSELTLKAGTVLGRIGATGKVVEMKSGAIDGSQHPVGVLPEDVKFAIGETLNVPFIVFGMVSKNRLIFDGADTLATQVSGRTYEDKITGETQGIELIASTELSKFDN